ncbi:MAG: YqgE/AlgH family protein [Flavobacteriia bacterium]|nr:YqgE/AlgH family protein [Flavobacteriia bacterium]
MDISFENKLKPQKGRILISDPFMGDEYFERSVVYLCEHSKHGSFGFVLNNYINFNLKDLHDKFPSIQVTLSIGGPVDKESIFFIHTLGNLIPESIVIDEEKGVYMGGNFDFLYHFITQEHIEKNEIRFFIGYSGWDKDQLDSELKNHSWIVSPIEKANDIMDAMQKDLWKILMQRQGKKFKLMTYFPINPNDN